MGLTEQQTLDLLDTNITPTHQHMFIRKWIHNPNRPAHITSILQEMSKLSKSELKKFYFYNDELYVIDYEPELYRYYYKTHKPKYNGWHRVENMVKKPKLHK